MQRHGKQQLTPEEAFATVLQNQRKKTGLSQEQLGFDSGYHRTYIGMLERGRMNPTLRTILSISSALKVPASRFMGLVEDVLGRPWRQPEKKVGRKQE